MRKLRELEDVLIRAESALAVVLVLVMLVLAGYNVVYRNVLAPLQQHWAHSGPSRSSALEVDAAPEREAKPLPTTPLELEGADDVGGSSADESEGESKAGADDFGGFGGGLGEEDDGATKASGEDFGGFGGALEDAEPEPEPTPEPPPTVVVADPPKSASDDFGGFGGDLDEPEPEPEPAAPEPKPASTPKPAAPEPKPSSDDFGGFGGGLDDGGDPPSTAEPKPSDGGAEGFGGFGGDAQTPAVDAPPDELGEDELGEDDLGDDDQFANLANIDAAGKTDTTDALEGGPPPEGSFAAWAVAFIDAIKLDWIDIFLRQLVIIVSFLGAMLATVRGKHINIDALSKVLPPKARRVVSVVIPLVAVSVCLVFASAGYDLVQIGREYPKELLPFAEEWMLQLMFPVGFGLLALHFSVRLVLVALDPPETEPPPKLGAAESAAVDPREPEADDDADDGDQAAPRGGQG